MFKNFFKKNKLKPKESDENYILYESSLNSLKAGVIGDAMGVPFEFGPGKTLSELSFQGGGIHEQLPGTWSDDTALTICTIDFLLNNENPLKNLDDMAKLIHLYVTKGLNTPDNKVFDVGNTIRNSSINYGKDFDYKTMGETSDRSNGNGALMRIMPVAIYNIREHDIKFIAEMTKLTHNTELCISINIIFCELVRHLYISKTNGVKFDDIYKILKISKIHFNQYIDEFYEGYKDSVNKYFDYLIDVRKFPEDIDYLDNGGYVLDTFVVMLSVLNHNKSLNDALLACFEIGGDTDTLASLVAQLGVFFYHEDLNMYFDEGIRNKHLIDSKINKYSKFISKRKS